MRAHGKSVYCGGPMTNRPGFNFQTFDEVSEAMRLTGWTVFNPHEHDQEVYPTIDEAEATKIGDVVGIVEEVGFSLATSMSWDFARIVEADAIILLPEWESSTGAKAERLVAEMTGSIVLLAEKNTVWYWYEDPIQKRMAASLTIAADVIEVAA